MKPARLLLAGGGVSALYLLAAAGSTFIHAPLYDGLAPPPPYRWVVAPPGASPGTPAPKGVEQNVATGPGGSEQASITTPDGQAGIILAKGAVVPHPGDPAGVIKITPLDPKSVGPPPGGFTFEGNAYRIEARFVSSHQDMSFTSADVVLRYPVSAGLILRWNGSSWDQLPNPTTEPALLEVVATATSGGTFAAASATSSASPSPPAIPGGSGASPWLYAAPAAALIAIAAAVVLRRRSR